MAHADQANQVAARTGSFGRLQGQGDGDAGLQLDMFGAPPRRSCGSNIEGMRAELKEILGAGAAAPELPGDDAAQLRLAFLRAELARVDAA